MNEAALYALEHIDKTVEIHDAISDMEELVFQGFDTAVKESISDWFGDNWQCDEDYNLMHGYINLYFIKDAPDWDKVYIALADENNGKNIKNIWTFLGKNNPLSAGDYFIWLATSEEEISKPQNDKVFEMKEIEELIEQQGFEKYETDLGYFWLQKAISFNSDDILKGLKGEGWEAALSPLREAWQPLIDLDWDEISKIVNETQE